MAVLKPQIDSISNGLISVSLLSPTIALTLFDRLLIFKSASTASGPFSQIADLALSSDLEYTFLDINSTPQAYYKAQLYNNTTMISSVFSELAQETSIYSEYSQPVSTATYPPEIALTSQDREIVESIRVTVGDLGSIERDVFTSGDPVAGCAENISADGCTWEFSEPRGWPQKVILNGEEKISLSDPQVLGYRYLVFSGSGMCISGSLDVFYNHFRFSDREILLAYDRSINLLVSCGLTSDQITTEMRIMQAAILLLEGELRDVNSGGVLRIRDGDTEYDNSRGVEAKTLDLEDLKRKMREMIECARFNASYKIQGVRVD